MQEISQSKLCFELLVSNIKASYYAATQYPSILQAGLNWYAAANSQASAIAQRTKYDIRVVVAVISALSPRNSWERNLLDAELLLKVATKGGTAKDFKVCTFDSNKELGLALANGASIEGTLTGNKRKDFYCNILCPKDPYVVTVDGHAISIALGKLGNAGKAAQLSDKEYRGFAEAYRQATREINADSLEGNVIPSQVQAITWSYYRVVRGIDKASRI